MTHRFFAAAAALAAVGALLCGCGYKGPLTMPESTGPVIIRPAAPATPPATKDPQAKPATQPTTTTPSPGSTPATVPAPTPEGTPTGG